jgi:uncharacterized membrane protein
MSGDRRSVSPEGPPEGPPATPASPAEPGVFPEHMVRNVQAITEMHLQAERTLSAHQRAIESGTARLGRPAFLYLILGTVALWMAANTLGPRVGLHVVDPPPFGWLQVVVSLLALLTTIMVLITQNRQTKMLERRMHLDLQINLITEQKTAKLIELLEELRRDLPNVRNRRDSEAETMQRAAEPLAVMAALDEHQTVEAARQGLATDDAATAKEEREERDRVDAG